MSDRRGMGLDISKSNSIKENGDGSFSVPSQSRKGVSYTVKLIGESWTCTCPDFVNRVGEIDACKHIEATRFWIAARVELRSEPKPKVFAEDSIQCPKCGSIKVVRFGTYNRAQVFKCKDCGRKFRDSLIKKAHYSPETITLTLDLYFSGLSVRKIARTLNDHFGSSLSKSSVYRWIEVFVPRISEYVNSLAPQLSETWHADELFVKMKGGISTSGGKPNNKNLAFLWNVMDRKTRFLLASRLSKYRNETGGIPAFKEAIENANGSKPETVFVDGLSAYPNSVRYSFGQDAPKLVARAGVGKPHANNNRIERLNGTLRERVKVQRGWKTMQTPLAEGQRIHYNFVKPHQALEGKTPAQAAGVGVDARNKWLAMLTEAITRDGTGGEITQR